MDGDVRGFRNPELVGPDDPESNRRSKAVGKRQREDL